MSKITIYHRPTNTYFYIKNLNKYINKMKGDFLSYDIFNNILIDNEEKINLNEHAILITPPNSINYII